MTAPSARPGGIVLRHVLTAGDVPAIVGLWAEIGWGQGAAAEEGVVRRAFAGSCWIAIAELDGRFAGYARALGDGVLLTYLAEVAVLPCQRRRGVGGALIRSCLDAFPCTAIYAHAAPEVVGLNARHGLVPRPAHLVACSRGPVRGGRE